METIETTYADLRPDDLVIDKAGNAWPVNDITDLTPTLDTVKFWLCDPATKVRMHAMEKPKGDPVTVSRVPSHADDAAKLEADFPKSSGLDGPSPVTATPVEAVEKVEEILGGTVEAEVTAEEVNAARAATEDAPVRLPLFDTMTPLEMRSHLYLLHGVYAADMKSRDETIQMHAKAHAGHDDGTLQSAYVPHIHTAEVK